VAVVMSIGRTRKKKRHGAKKKDPMDSILVTSTRDIKQRSIIYLDVAKIK